ncbi:MAG TPA: signal peptidase II [Patescibacteria group bacterium]|nr:signal peptidase II [Patescibacteria group bacterium]
MQKNSDAGDVKSGKRIWDNVFFWPFFLAGLIIIADQIVKYVVFSKPAVAGFWFGQAVITLIQFRNFGLLANIPAPQPLIIGTTILVLILIGFFFARALREQRRYAPLVLAVLFAGALGNLIDRVWFGYVRDWLLLFGHSAVNLADAAVAVGGIGFLWEELTRETKESIKKAGAILIREGEAGPEILLLFRGNHKDWTFPKGHVEPGETVEACMRREIQEETGLEIDIIRRLPDNNYADASRKSVTVAMFLAKPRDVNQKERPEFPGDQPVWVKLEEVETQLSYENLKQYFRSNLDSIRSGLT